MYPDFVHQLITKGPKCLPIEILGISNEKGELQACTLVVHDKGRSYYLAGGLRNIHRNSSSLNYALFEAMIDRSLARGNVFDFEGSMDAGIEQFFRGWGGRRVHCIRVLKGQGFPGIAALLLHGILSKK